MTTNTEHRHRRRARTAWYLPVAAVTAALAVAACGSSSSSNSSNSASAGSGASAGSATTSGSSGSAASASVQQYLAAPTKINVTTPLKSAPPSGKTIVFLGTTQPQNVIVQQTVQKIAGLAHWNYSLVDYDPANPGSLTSAISSALAKHPQYLVEVGNPLTPAQLSTVKQAGAKWIVSSVYPVSVSGPVISQSDSYADDALQGKIIADYFASDSNGKGNAVIEHVPAYPILDGFTNSFQAEVKAKCPACKTTMVNVTIPQLTAGQLPSTVVSALRSNPSANYVVFDDGPFAAGITSALASAGLTGKVKVIGQAADTTGLADLKNGSEQAWTGFDPTYQGLQTMDAAFRDAEGMSIPLSQEAVEPTQLLTKQNVGQITSWSGPTDALSQFEALWHVK
jgi:ribose transport system substrate-binding protein